MAVEIKSRLKVAMNTGGGNPSAFLGLQQGVDSIFRVSSGVYEIDLTEAIDSARATYSITPQTQARIATVSQPTAATLNVVTTLANGTPTDTPFTLMVWELSPTE